VAEDNLERTRRANAAFNDRDLNAWGQHFDADVVFDDRNPTPGVPPVIHGFAALRKLIEDWVEAMPDFRVELGEMDAAGDCVVDVLWWEDGKIVYYLTGLQSREEGMRAVAEDHRVQTS
jgi:ketosteroid isomerase-like protein